MTTQSTVTAINPLTKSVWQPLPNAERANIKKAMSLHGTAALATFSDRQIALINAGGMEK